MPRKIKAIRYGESGSGKTVMAGTWPVEGKILVFDFDSGALGFSHKLNGINKEVFENLIYSFSITVDGGKVVWCNNLYSLVFESVLKAQGYFF